MLVTITSASVARACTPLPAYHGGRLLAELCEESLPSAWTRLELADDWAPRILSETPELPQPYRATFVALANERLGQGREWSAARRDAHFELFGIFPSFSVLRARFADAERHACHERIDGVALRAPLASAETRAGRAARRAAIEAAQAHLACERLLPSSVRRGVWSAAMEAAIAHYQRRYMLPSPPELDDETREALLTPSRELDFLTLLRALRERVADATGWIEDGSARDDWQPILGRQIESAEYRPERRAEPRPEAAPNLIARATEAAARALGWTSPEAAAAALFAGLPRRVAVMLPAPPAYHSPQMSLRVEIERSVELARAAGGGRVTSGRRPLLTLFAQTPGGEIPLVRWPTTVGGWKRERLSSGRETLRFKPSPSGRFLWRDLWVAPTWFPPPTTPDRELLRLLAGGGWTVDREVMGPGYRSAYGLVALLHHRSVAAREGAERLVDTQIRTHGSGNYRSVLRGTSHGCHRLFNHLAIRLGGFLLAHLESVRRGSVAERYSRRLEWGGQRFQLSASSRGYRYELSTPVPVDVLPAPTTRARPAQDRPSAPAPEARLQPFEADEEC